MISNMADALPMLDIRCEAIPCKVCGAASPLDGVIDFNKCASEQQAVLRPLWGVPVYYHRCPDCRLLFTVAFDRWTTAEFQRHIYNDGYAEVDPDYSEARPVSNAGVVANFVARGENLNILDYGGGNGRLARELVARGFTASSWDTMEPSDVRPAVGSFDVVTCFEVMEHTPTPVETFADAISYLKPGGVMLFSTLTIDALSPRSMEHWYILPRNGHVTIYTKRSLALLAAKFGHRIHHFDDVLHLGLTEVPNWLR
ncbi:MAG TPA: class I SAM-dependent methyltransferase [Xanthobacteraceae bacterium]|jgi:2-polyprenyl-6-hydroxyphenyl methylase/3-demethylubiquinone-9 3-methyltransferase|nr:class I SAM-dependent methyltransferase [Xanthobacteraceae bacterium]